MITRRAALFSVVALFLISQSAAAPKLDFDQGVDVNPILEQAREDASVLPPEAVRHQAIAVGKRTAETLDDIVWVSVAKQDVSVLEDAFNFPNPVSTSDLASVYRVKVSELPGLTHVMRDNFHRCPGYFAHTTLQAAETDLSAMPSPSLIREYSIDQKEQVATMLAMVDESSISGVISSLSDFKNRYYRADTGVESAKWIAAYWGRLTEGRSDMSVSLYTHGSFPQGTPILTVTGAAEPDKVVILGGHEDSIAGFWGGANSTAPGADDNASGIAVITEVIRVMVASGYQPSQTVQFMAYAAEEVGLRGSRQIADEYKDAGTQVQGVLQLDMTGYNGSDKDIYFISDNTDSSQNAFLGKLIEEYTDYSWDYTKCGYGCSDHASWTRNEFAASFPFESKMGEESPDIHSSRDTLASMDAGHSVKFAKLAVAYMVEMAK